MNGYVLRIKIFSEQLIPYWKKLKSGSPWFAPEFLAGMYKHVKNVFWVVLRRLEQLFKNSFF
jgi:hypothetical protein